PWWVGASSATSAPWFLSPPAQRACAIRSSSPSVPPPHWPGRAAASCSGPSLERRANASSRPSAWVQCWLLRSSLLQCCPSSWCADSERGGPAPHHSTRLGTNGTPLAADRGRQGAGGF